MADNVTIWLAFSGGLLAFISPCTLPLYPSFLSYITGMSVKELQEASSRGFSRIILVNASLFLVGFSLIYYVLGYSASLIGDVFFAYSDVIRMLGAIFIGLMGLFMLGIFQPKLLMKEFRLPFKRKKNGAMSSLLVGIIFAAGWTPCIGPIFGAIIYANIVYPGQMFINISAYSLGFGIPFLLMAFFVGRLKWILKYSAMLMKLGGLCMLILAVLLYLDKMVVINIWFQKVMNVTG